MGAVNCGKCGAEYADSNPLCPECGEPFRLNSLVIQPEPVVTGKVTRINPGIRPSHKGIAISLRVPGLVVLVVAASLLIFPGLLIAWFVRKFSGR